MTMKKKTIEIRLNPDSQRCKKPKPLVNPKQARAKLLAMLREVRPALADRITRVSPSAITALEGDLINCMRNRLQHLPSVGKTLTFE